MGKVLMKGNEAVAEAAILGGCKFFFGYPITPQNEIPEYMAKRLPQVGGTFLQAESETSAINMVYGAAGAGARVMTSSSSPGISLKQEGISYIAGAELPCVIVNMVRGGPGLGNIAPAQSDYFQATKGGGHGDYRLVVYGPASVQELVDLTIEAFDVADRYRNPVMILGDGILGQMMEPVEFKVQEAKQGPDKPWATTGAKGRERNIINSLYIVPEDLARHCAKLQAKYDEIAAKEKRCEEYFTADAEIVLAAYGTTARICKAVVDQARQEGIKAGLIRPITLWPFPDEPFRRVAEHADAFMAVEMSTGQMVEDVRLAVNGKKPVYFFGRTGGIVPTKAEIFAEMKKRLEGGTR
ncbi:3-methyl-2-oxobutanoate dehydrogenase subunit VorB [Thermincola potens]|uniref:Pyruvate flavodoxin/ferredoxin oxidoreductase domain protein n=1 Tax=Thermincola potens (strain JR) TaxID=635013 RepID=D5X7F7_THEPJ|nr:3-methyl-2-oxobutanoate dehydrogenase subunit VorB [Thermincola potens]ADG82527.1 pyruvate flavodoxin/ferredoxin oxidoreductase domain protein [Thermincola potens JR]